MSLTALRLNDTHPFDATSVDNCRPLFVKEVFCEKNDDKLYKVWLTLYTCASTKTILLDLVPRPNSTSFSSSSSSKCISAINWTLQCAKSSEK